MKYLLTITTLFLFVNIIGQTPKSLAGFIQDKTGTPLEAVTILIKGTNLGTATDSNGRFLFTKLTMNDAVLECSKIGYETQHIIVQLTGVQSTSIHIVLMERVTSLRSVTVYSNSLRAVSTILPTINISLKDQLFTLTLAFGHLMAAHCI